MATRYAYTPYTKLSHYGLSITLHQLIKSCPIYWKIFHVKCHKDDGDKYNNIDEWGGINIEAYRLTKDDMWHQIHAGALSIWNRKIVFFRILYSWLSFFLQRNSSSVSLYVFTFSDTLFLKHHSALQLSRQLNMYSRGPLLASLNSPIVFYLLFLSCTPNLS